MIEYTTHKVWYLTGIRHHNRRILFIYTPSCHPRQMTFFRQTWMIRKIIHMGPQVDASKSKHHGKLLMNQCLIVCHHILICWDIELVGFCQMWAKIITIKRTKDLNYFSLCALNLFNTWVSQFELNYWNKWTFTQHSNLLRCTCI